MGPIAIGQVYKITLIAAGAMALSMAAPASADANLLGRYAHWEQKLRDRVNSLLVYPDGMQAGEAGDVFVTFTLGQDGRPQRITIKQSSGEPIFDRAAVQLVSNLGRIGAIPSATRAINQVTLKLSYGEPCARAPCTRCL